MKTALKTAAVVMTATASLAACQSNGGAKTKATDVASSPTPQQLWNNVHDWLNAGGDEIVVHLRADLLTTETGGWQTDPYLAKEVADSIFRTDVPNALNFRPVPDQQAQQIWVGFINKMKQTGIDMEHIGGDLSTPMNKVAVANSTDDLNQAQAMLDRFERRLTVIDQEADK